MTLTEAKQVAPAAPACFGDRDGWVAYLVMCQDSAKREPGRPFAEGKFKPSFDFCRDCTPEHRLLMRLTKRCEPATFRGVAVNAE